ncbi:efflux RND transporter periplasmic adaptor subunit [Thalassomonas viridans]|uniref:Efflux RND transporter periplasmic adaptor subunit n=1 Tax=Thalassomonas viridans TaxID=137584 RepID=A0AAE9Z270_9GAMM|nr:efflux RND transporter periplasmic adaptor subunit [Thalassomonas viridans]WDE05260.1 efflux RND transporter periplasmic adaptor subunit [Thalassomonas viridans]
MKMKLITLIPLVSLLAFTAGVYAQEQKDPHGHEHDHGGQVEQDNHDGHQAHEENEHDDEHSDEHGDHEAEDGHGHGEAGEGSEVSLTGQQIQLAGIEVANVNAAIMDYQLYAPGEIKANGYTSYLVSPRVDSVVLRRHVGLGDHVEEGQPLVTLFSETVAEAQAAFRVASSEWQRIQKLGKKSVGDKRYISGQSAYNAALGRLQAYGLSKDAIASLAKSSQPLGEYTLSAISGGAILSDDFQQGQRVESGESLMVVADEHTLWVEARLAPDTQLDLPVGTLAKVKVGNNYFTAKVTQEAHTIDLVTRTRIVRLEVANDDHLLHSGMFADVYFSLKSREPVVAVPETALMRSSDGDWVVFIEDEPRLFVMQEVVLGRTFNNVAGQWREIKGVAARSRIVTKGAFFIASQLAKGGFDPHNH